MFLWLSPTLCQKLSPSQGSLGHEGVRWELTSGHIQLNSGHTLLTFKVKSLSPVQLFATPWIVACTKLLHPWDFQGKSTAVGCRFLLQGIFPTQGSNPGLSHCRQTLYHLSHQGKSLI